VLYRMATLLMTLSNPNYRKPPQFLYFALPFIYSWQVTLETSNLVCGLNISSPSLQMTNLQTVPEMGVVTSRDPV